MPGPLHETFRELFAKRPELIAPLLRRRVRLPKGPLVAIDSEQTDPRMPQLLPDAVLACPDGTSPEMVVIVEVQLGRTELKRRAWPQYTATAHARYGCPAQVVVITPYEHIARWAARPIRVGVGHTMRVHVIGPSKIPMLRRTQIEAAPVMGMLATLAHMDDGRAAEQALWTLAGLATWPDELGSRLADILQAALTAELRDQLEELMRTGKYEYQSDFAKKYFGQGLEQGREEGREEGRARGIADSLLTVLRSRGLRIDLQGEQRITTERDETRLETWLRRAVTAKTLDEVFADE